jgi:glycosyltransferase involved in cell wall biosynthesis
MVAVAGRTPSSQKERGLKLIVTIPAFNEEGTIGEVIQEIPRAILGVRSVEVLVLDDGSSDQTVAAALAAGADYVVSNGSNRGLAFSFQRALNEALARGADVIVNTDADNHYDQSRIPDLIQPILRGNADIVVGSRVFEDLEMRWGNKQGNRLANFILQRLLRIPGVDVSSGYRAYTRAAALSLNVVSSHTYTHETLFSAMDRKLRVVSLPLPARHVSRPSRLISSLPAHVWRAGCVILQSILRYRPTQVYGSLGATLFLVGLAPFFRFLYFFANGDGSGHVQSLIAGGVLLFLGAQFFVFGLVAQAISWNRQLLEEVLYRLKDTEQPRDSELPSPAVTHGTNGRSRLA